MPPYLKLRDFFSFRLLIIIIIIIIANRFIVLPQLLDDYLQQRAAPIPRSRYKEIDEIEEEVKAVDILTAEVSVLKKNCHYSSY